MPSTRPRHTVTETEEIASALDLAQRRWPQERNRKALLILLIREGRKTVEADEDTRVRERRTTICAVSGAATGMFSPGYLEELRGDWPQ